MGSLLDCTGARAIVYDEDKHAAIAKTEVLDYQRGTHTITLSRSAFHREELPEHMAVLIIQNAAVYEFKGTVRKLGKGAERIDIALYKGQEKEDREVTRYTVNTPARVESLIMVGKLVPIPNPFDVIVCNISSKGCLIQGAVTCLNVGAAFQLKLLTDQAPILMYATVLRVIPQKGGIAQFGCSFTTLESKRLPPPGKAFRVKAEQ